MGMPAPIYYTVDMVRALPDDGKRYEVVRGELLVTPAPRTWHQEVLGRLYASLGHYLERSSVGHVFFSPADITWGREDTLVQPDLFVVPLEDARTMQWAAMRRLLLVAEIMSPSSGQADRFVKRAEYQRQGVSIYWLVDPDARLVEVWTPDDHFPLFERERLVWHPVGAAEPFTVELAELFRPI